jgi:hypothetical protein
MKINNNWVPIMQGRFIPATVLPLCVFCPAAGDCVPGEEGRAFTDMYRDSACYPSKLK